ncbi:MAG: long-chain fatty acid--CoA ligase [Baekduiaceae bacterium]
MTLGRLVLQAADRHAAYVAMQAPGNGGWQDISFAELGRAAREIAAGLHDLGLGPGDRVAILGATRQEWTLADCGALLAGATVVPIYHTNPASECRYVLAHSGACAVICEDAEQLAKIRAVQPDCVDLKHVITMVPTDDPDAPSLDDLRARGRAAGADVATVEQFTAGVRDVDVATIVYTSGTTGPPKGCMLTHANVLSTLDMYARQVRIEPGSVAFFFLPLAHALARVTQFVALDVGATLAFYSRDPAKLLDDVATLRPTHLPSVPRLFEKIHTRAMATASDEGGLKAGLFRRSLATARRARAIERAGGRPDPVLRARRAMADRLVLHRVRDLLGGRIELCLTGAAPISVDVLEFFDACGITIIEGYGMTESCAAGTLSTPGHLKFGTVGRALPGSEVKVAADGEILLRGPHVFPGYYRNDEATRETIDTDGWLHTGDLGSLDDDGYLRITGRAKDIIITSSGKNITPSNLEADLRESRWISQAVVYGDQHPYLVALLTLDPEEAPALAQRLGVDDDPAKMAGDPRVRDALQEEIDRVNRDVSRISEIKRFGVLDRDLTLDDDELTPTLKVKRNRVYEHHHDFFEHLYDGERS